MDEGKGTTMATEILKPYKLGDRLGSGGFGVVYKAVSIRGKKQVAVKVLERPENDDAVKRFQREVRVLTQLDHPNVIKVISFDVDVAKPWFAMPLATRSLREVIPHLGPGKEEEVEAIFRQVLSGVGYAQNRAVIHGDLKPENVLIMADGSAMVSDFGMGRRPEADTEAATLTDHRAGTPTYASPEQLALVQPADARTDIYSLGKLLYEMLTLNLPWPSVDLGSVPEKYRYIVGRCIRPDPPGRFISVRQLLGEMQLIHKEDEFQDRTERARQMAVDVLGLDARKKADVARLDEILQRERNDNALYLALLPRIPPPLIKAYAAEYPAHFMESIARFDQIVGAGLDADYTDSVADLYQVCYRARLNLELRRLILARLLTMGCKYNRFHVRDVFWGLICTIDGYQKELAVAAADVIAANPDAAQWMAERMSRYPNVLPEIQVAFPVD